MGDLATDTAVEGSDGRYHAELSPDWEIWGPNGGYLAVIALRAAGAHVPLRRPASFACHFLGVAEFDAVDVHVRTLRESRRATSMAVSVRQRHRPILEAIAWVVGELDGLEHDASVMPAVPPPDELGSIDDLLPPERRSRFRFWANLEERPVDFIDNWEERTAGSPRFRSWFRFRPTATFADPFVDAGRALLLADLAGGWPAVVRAYDAGELPYYAPTLDVAVQFHAAVPASPWLLGDGSAPVAREGLIGGRASVWSTDGTLAATGNQHMMCRPTRLRESGE